MGGTWSTQYAGGNTSQIKSFLHTGDEAGQRLLVTLRREEQNIRLEVKQLAKTVRSLAKKGCFEPGDDDDNPDASAEAVVTQILEMERFRNKCIALNKWIVQWHSLYKVTGHIGHTKASGKNGNAGPGFNGGRGSCGGSYNSPKFRVAVRKVAQTLGNLRADKIYRQKNGPLEEAAEREWPEPLIIEDRIRTYCDYGGDQGHAADPIRNGIAYAEVDPEFSTEDYLAAYARADVKSFDAADQGAAYRGVAKGKRWYGSGAGVRTHQMEDTTTRAFQRTAEMC